MNKVIVVLLGIITVVVLLVGGFWIGMQMSETNKTTIPTQSPAPTQTPTPTVLETKGFIEGSLSFPSEGIPENMFVCAETTEGEKVICTDNQIKDEEFQYGVGYKLEIEPGTYFVYAKTPDSDYKAYYTEFVNCGMSVDCDSHKKIMVEVKNGQITSEVDPGDWYIQEPQQNET
jgi:hypothetical protein